MSDPNRGGLTDEGFNNFSDWSKLSDPPFLLFRNRKRKKFVPYLPCKFCPNVSNNKIRN